MSPPLGVETPDALVGVALGTWILAHPIRTDAATVAYLAESGGDDGALDALVVVPRANAAEQGLAQLEREHAALQRVHPAENVVGLLGADLTARPTPWLALEFVSGPTIHELLGQGPLELRRALELSVGILRGLGSLHRAGVTHNDLRASSIRISRDGTVRLMGLRRAVIGGAASPADPGQTPAHPPARRPSPERFRSEPPAPPVDLYAFGTILFRMLTGRPPLTGADPDDLLRAHGEDPAPHASDLIEDIPARLDVLVSRLLSKVPSARPDAEAALEAISNLRANLPNLGEETDQSPLAFIELRAGDELNGYVLERELGRGGAGVTYAGRDAHGTRYALKVAGLGTSPEKAREQLRRDAEHAAQVRHHPSVARVYGTGEGQVRDVPIVYLRSELVEGPSLARLLDQHGALPIRAVRHLWTKVAEGLAAIHAAGVLHLDLKPSNILLDRPIDPTQRLELQLLQAVPKIIDFGISRRANEATTSTGVEGTPYYMSPEQCEGMVPAPSADIYSLGATFFHVATGSPAFTGEQLVVLHKQVNQSAPSAQLEGRLGHHLGLVLSRCMLKDPESRYPNTEELLEDLFRAGGRDFPSRELESARDREQMLLTGRSRRTPPGSEGFKRRAHAFAPLARLLSALSRPARDRQGVERTLGWIEQRVDELRTQLLDRPDTSGIELEVLANVLGPRLRERTEHLDDAEARAALEQRLSLLDADLAFLLRVVRVRAHTLEETWGPAREALRDLTPIGETQARNRLVRVRVERDLRERLDEVRWDLEEARAKVEALLDAGDMAWAARELDAFLRRHPDAEGVDGVPEVVAALRARLDGESSA